MGHHLDARRRQIRRTGRWAALTRAGVSPSVVTLLVKPRDFDPDEMANPGGSGGVIIGDLQVHTLNDEIAAAGWPAPPAKPDSMLLDGRRHVVQQAWPVHEGALLIGWKIWLRPA